MDKDPEAIAHAEATFGDDARVQIRRGSFAGMAHWDAVADGLDGVLLDLGVSSPQLDVAERGFSFGKDGPLDMRMDPATGSSAADFLARAPEHELARVIREYGEEKFAKRIARDIVAARREGPIERTGQLAEIVARAVRTREPGKHPATRTFQAIRIHVNDELGELQSALRGSLEVLAPGGRLCAIAFHSLEDGIVKRFIQQQSQEDPVYAGLPQVPEHARPKLRRVGRAVHPSAEEVAANPRARSAVMRVAERIAA
jgi:16S rRNA (cytosine1402-N4)-methyltransferase